jgi:predicted HTH domain antitoxin
MEITIRIPDDLADRLGAARDLPRRALEALAVDEFQRGHLTLAELRRLLGFGTRDALDGFLKAHNIESDYALDDLERERDDLRRLGF